MAKEKRLIDANALREQMFSYYGCVNKKHKQRVLSWRNHYEL